MDALPPLLQTHVLARVAEAAEIGLPLARAFEARLRKTLDHPAPNQRIFAAVALWRLGDETMADRLVKEHHRAMQQGDENAAWSAVGVPGGQTG